MERLNAPSNPVYLGLVPAAALIIWGLACGGATFGENAPGDPQYGGGTYLDDAVVDSDTPLGAGENGSLAVDPDTEYTYTVQVRQVENPNCDAFSDEECSETLEEKRLVVVPPEGQSRELMDLTGFVDVRILFPASSVLVMAEPKYSKEKVETGECAQPADPAEATRCGDALFWFDKRAERKLREKWTDARYHGTRLSPKRNYIVVADNFQDPATIHLVNANDGHINVVPQGGEWFEGQWLREQDVFITAHFNRADTSEDVPAYLTIREWFPNLDGDSADPGESVCFYRGDRAPEGCDSYGVLGIDPQFVAGFSWIGVSSNDRFVAVPAKNDDGDPVVIVVDRDNRELDFIPGAHGPVGFTPDGNHMVAFGWEEGEKYKESYLLFVDLETGAVEKQPTPELAIPTFFVSHDSADVVVVNTGGSKEMVIIDLAREEMTTMPGPAVAEQTRRYYLREQQRTDMGTIDQNQKEVVSADDIQVAKNDAVCIDRVCEETAPVEVTLSEFVSRNGHQELWLIEDERLLHLDLEIGELKEVAIEGRPSRINILPNRDRLVIDNRGAQELRYFDPETRRIDWSTDIALGWR